MVSGYLADRAVSLARSSWFNCHFQVPSPMYHGGDRYLFGVDLIYDPIAVCKDLTNRLVFKFRNHSSEKRKLGKFPCLLQDRTNDGSGIIFGICRNVSRDRIKIFDRTRRPTQDISHFPSFSSTSFCVKVPSVFAASSPFRTFSTT